MKIKVEANVKATLPPSSCFHLATELEVAAREAETARIQAKKGKQVRRFSSLMDNIKISLVLAAGAKPGVSKEAMKIAQKVANAEFDYLAGTAAPEKRLKQFAVKIDDLQWEIIHLVRKVSKRCGLDWNKKGESEISYKHRDQLRSDMSRLELKAQKRRVK